MSRDPALLLDIVLAANDARRFVEDLDWRMFVKSRLHQNAVIRSLEVIGEAAGKSSPAFTRAHPDVPWRDIVNMRHRLIHAYDDVRLDTVWAIVRNDLAPLVAKLQPYVPPDDPTS